MASNVQTEEARQERLRTRRDTNNGATRQRETSAESDATFVFGTQNNRVASTSWLQIS